jgi:phage host-nuclease inhibitor protein Gam
MSAQPITDAWDDLDDFMSGVEGLVVEPDAMDQTLAERMVRRVLRLRRQFDADAEVARAQHEQVDAWLARQQAKLDQSTEYLLRCLQQYHEARLAEDPKAKTIHLPSGSLVARKAPDRWEFDTDQFVTWAQERGLDDLLRVKVEPDKPVVKQKLVTAADGRVIDMDTGEFVPGVEIHPGEVGYSVKADD